ncbi:MAG: ArsR family transcriptional regulator [Chloroflexi bacterium]|nr:ArsR family transcriptional regulator [Chloroflexota bacterium]
MQDVLQRPPEGSRQQILQLLQRRSFATVDDLARQTGLASATVRRHLDILQRDHLVAYRQVRKKAGRPEYSYFLTDTGQETLPKSYGRLLGLLVGELAALPEEETRGLTGEALVRHAMGRLATRAVQAVPQAPREKGFSGRVARAQAVLAQEEFAPEVERVNGSVRVHLHNCPFRTVALRNPVLCSYDSTLLTSALGQEVVLERCIRDGSLSCTYLVTPPKGRV